MQFIIPLYLLTPRPFGRHLQRSQAIRKRADGLYFPLQPSPNRHQASTALWKIFLPLRIFTPAFSISSVTTN